MTAEPLVGIVVLMWNGWADTAECLRSLRAQDYANRRVYLVDNASTDGSADSAERDFSEVVVLRNPANLGFAAGCNVGIRAALADDAGFVLLLNNDTVSDPGMVSALVAACGSDEGIGITGAKVYYADRPDVIYYAGAVRAPGLLIPRVLGLGERDAGQYDISVDVDYIWGQAMMIRRQVLGRVGLLDENFFMYCEDRDFCLRAKDAGFRLVYAPAARIWHKVGASIQSHPEERWRYRSRSLAYFYRKHSPHGAAQAWLGYLTESAWILAREAAKGKLGLAARLWRPYFAAVRGGGK